MIFPPSEFSGSKYFYSLWLQVHCPKCWRLNAWTKTASNYTSVGSLGSNTGKWQHGAVLWITDKSFRFNLAPKKIHFKLHFVTIFLIWRLFWVLTLNKEVGFWSTDAGPEATPVIYSVAADACCSAYARTRIVLRTHTRAAVASRDGMTLLYRSRLHQSLRSYAKCSEYCLVIKWN